MYNAGHAIQVTGLTYRQLDHVIRIRMLRPSRGVAQGRGTVRGFSIRDLLALRLAQQILHARHRLPPFMPALHFVQRGRGLPALDELDGTLLVGDGVKVRVLDGTELNLPRASKARGVFYVVDLGAAVRHVRHRIERIAQTAM